MDEGDSPQGRGWQVDEAARAAVLSAYDLDALRHTPELRRVTDFAAALCEVPVALVTVLDEVEQTFLSRTGLDVDAMPRAISFCDHAIRQDALMVVDDLSADPRFVANPLVTGDQHARFYAGVPLLTEEGVALGTLCVVDRVARPGGLSALQRQGLETLAADVMARLRDTRDAAAWRDADADARRRLFDSEQRFHMLADAMPQMVWSTLPDGYHDYYNARWYEYTGMAEGSTDGIAWNGVLHPEDQDRASARWRHSLTTGEPYGIEYRLRNRDGNYRWVLGRALPIRDTQGRITRWFGTCTDIHEQKVAAEEREVISQELSHRIKNIFAVIAGLISFAARNRPEFAPVAHDLRQRITALGRAHDFVRPHSLHSRPAARQDSLHAMLAELFAPYAGSGAGVTVIGDDVRVDDRSATPLALLFHELATNATKYGALSADGGMVTLDIAPGDGDVTLVWRETGGPAVIAPSAKPGFGTQLIELSAVRQLGGTVTRDWRPEGLVLTVVAPSASFSR